MSCTCEKQRDAVGEAAAGGEGDRCDTFQWGCSRCSLDDLTQLSAATVAVTHTDTHLTLRVKVFHPNCCHNS